MVEKCVFSLKINNKNQLQRAQQPENSQVWIILQN